jgi:hypothetical protein
MSTSEDEDSALRVAFSDFSALFSVAVVQADETTIRKANAPSCPV